MTTIAELGSFLAREAAAANPTSPLPPSGRPGAPAMPNGVSVPEWPTTKFKPGGSDGRFVSRTNGGLA